LALGLALGVAGIVGSEFLDDRIYDDKEFKKMIPVELMVEVPPVISPEEEAQSRRQSRLGWLATAAMVVAVIAGVAVSFIRS